jgi:hypothetical protein
VDCPKLGIVLPQAVALAENAVFQTDDGAPDPFDGKNKNDRECGHQNEAEEDPLPQRQIQHLGRFGHSPILTYHSSKLCAAEGGLHRCDLERGILITAFTFIVSAPLEPYSDDGRPHNQGNKNAEPRPPCRQHFLVGLGDHRVLLGTATKYTRIAQGFRPRQRGAVAGRPLPMSGR